MYTFKDGKNNITVRLCSYTLELKKEVGEFAYTPVHVKTWNTEEGTSCKSEYCLKHINKVDVMSSWGAWISGNTIYTA